MANGLTNEEKKRLSYERQVAVKNAWAEERERVKNGQGTRNWTPDQQKELLERGAVSGYQGHHMKSVSLYPKHAGNSKNIQFLKEDEHLKGAHKGNYHNATNGYYDPEKKKMNEFKGDELNPVPVISLKERYSENQKSSPERTQDTSNEKKVTDPKTSNTNAQNPFLSKINEKITPQKNNNQKRGRHR